MAKLLKAARGICERYPVGPASPLEAGLVVERVGNVGVHVPDLAAGRNQHDDDNQSDENQDEGVLHQALAGLRLIGHDSPLTPSTHTEAALVVLGK